MARALWLKYILCHSKDQRSFLWLIIHYTIPCFGTIYTIELHIKGFLAKLAFVIDYGCSLGRAKMWSGGQGQVKTCWHLCHAVVTGWWIGLSLRLDDVSWRKNVLNVPALFCFQEFPSSCDLHIFGF